MRENNKRRKGEKVKIYYMINYFCSFFYSSIKFSKSLRGENFYIQGSFTYHLTLKMPILGSFPPTIECQIIDHGRLIFRPFFPCWSILVELVDYQILTIEREKKIFGQKLVKSGERKKKKKRRKERPSFFFFNF